MVYGSLQAFSFPRPFSLFRGSYRLEPRLVPSRLLFIYLFIYLFLFALEYGKAINARKPFWEGGRKVTPSFPLCTANSLNPTHKPQRGQEKRLNTSLSRTLEQALLYGWLCEREEEPNPEL